jgi:glutaredoxin
MVKGLLSTGAFDRRSGDLSAASRRTRRAAADTITRPAVETPYMTEPQITLYRLQACPYCERVVRTLDRFGLEYQSRYVEPMHSERNVVKRVSGARSVPAIVDRETGVTMSESANIVEYLEGTYGEGGA